jgi:hypothetical protein
LGAADEQARFEHRQRVADTQDAAVWRLVPVAEPPAMTFKKIENQRL